MQEIINILEKFETAWPEYTKNEPFRATIGKKRALAIAFEAGSFRIALGTWRGPRGGVHGVMTVVDPTKDVFADRLLCSSYLYSHERPLSDLWLMLEDGFGKTHRAVKFDEMCPKFLIKKKEQFQANPKLLETYADMIGLGNTSVITVSGGAPSLGKNR